MIDIFDMTTLCIWNGEKESFLHMFTWALRKSFLKWFIDMVVPDLRF